MHIIPIVTNLDGSLVSMIKDTDRSTFWSDGSRNKHDRTFYKNNFDNSNVVELHKNTELIKE